MKWTPARQKKLKKIWQYKTDYEIGQLLGTTAGSIRKQRTKLGLYRDKFKNYFIVQVTTWLGELSDCDYWSEWLKSKNVEHIVAGTDRGYAIFRSNIEFISTVEAPPKSAWVLHWRPKK